ncbi:hypothetical protein F511_36996 [Dorcoceras hygrometricum]|uniref:Uncharacterized protein n=1 Tax=Dorcoceras hygrometricum TaxID=472368 RepID=A0A2Z7AC28_9LAMI|nr:hypothetical protein F511_36996 [Dorcoceras hygrometricum]
MVSVEWILEEYPSARDSNLEFLIPSEPVVRLPDQLVTYGFCFDFSTLSARN